MATLEQHDGIFVMYLPMSLTIDVLISINSCLDEVEKHSGPTGLILASKHPKIFSAGMDLKFIMKNGVKSGVAIAMAAMKVTGRLFSLGVPTVAAINGHVIAAGLVMALSCDYRVMSQDHGTLKMSEILLGMVMPLGASAVLKAKLSPCVHRDLIFRAKSYAPQEALKSGMVDYLVEGPKVLEKATEVIKEVMQFGKKKRVYRELKRSTYFDTINTCLLGEYAQEFIDAMAMDSIKI